MCRFRWLLFLLFSLGWATCVLAQPVFTYLPLDPPDPDEPTLNIPLRLVAITEDGHYAGNGLRLGYRLSDTLLGNPILCQNAPGFINPGRLGPDLITMNHDRQALLNTMSAAGIPHGGIEEPDGTCTFFTLLAGLRALTIGNDGVIDCVTWVAPNVERTFRRYRPCRREADGTLTELPMPAPDVAQFATGRHRDGNIISRIGYEYYNITPNNFFQYRAYMCVQDVSTNTETCRNPVTAAGEPVWLTTVNASRDAMCVVGRAGSLPGPLCIYHWDTDSFEFPATPPDALRLVPRKMTNAGSFVYTYVTSDGLTPPTIADHTGVAVLTPPASPAPRQRETPRGEKRDRPSGQGGERRR